MLNYFVLLCYSVAYIILGVVIIDHFADNLLLIKALNFCWTMLVIFVYTGSTFDCIYRVKQMEKRDGRK